MQRTTTQQQTPSNIPYTLQIPHNFMLIMSLINKKKIRGNKNFFYTTNHFSFKRASSPYHIIEKYNDE